MCVILFTSMTHTMEITMTNIEQQLSRFVTITSAKILTRQGCILVIHTKFWCTRRHYLIIHKTKM
jgi:hypothetical protein